MGPPEQERTATQARAIGWYFTKASPAQVLSWVEAHPPTGSQLEGSGSGTSGPSFLSFQYPTPHSTHSTLYVTPETGADGRTVIRLDAMVDWVPSRSPDSLVQSGAGSVSVVTVTHSVPPRPLPAAETTPLRSTDPQVIGRIVDLLNALTPPLGGMHSCPISAGTSVTIELDGRGRAEADPQGCGYVILTLPGRQPQILSGGPDLVSRVYALFGVAWNDDRPGSGPGPRG